VELFLSSFKIDYILKYPHYLKINLIVFLFVLLSTIGKSAAQMGYKSLGTVYSNASVSIEMKVKMSKNPCAQLNSDNQFILKMKGVEQAFSGQNFLKWKMRIIQCNGDILEKNFTIDLSKYHLEGNNESQDWSFPGERIEPTFYDPRIEANDYNDKDLLIKNIKSSPPRSILGNLLLMTGDSTSLSVSPDGQLASNSNWYWYKDSCSGKYIGRGQSITVAPQVNTTYFVRAEGKNDTSACVSALVEVDDDSKAPTKIIGPANLCSGGNTPIKLEVYGGKLGYKANWVWYEDACGMIKRGVGKYLSITATKTTTFYVRAEGQTNTTTCASLTIYVQERSTDPSAIIGDNKVCQGESTKLTVQGGTLSAGARWVWYAGSVNKSDSVGVGAWIEVSPNNETTYYVRGEGPCNTTKALDFKVYVSKASKLPDYISINQIKKKKYQLTAVGGVLGDNSNWVWYNDKCSGNTIGSGKSIEYKVSKKNNFYVQAKGGCADPVNCVFKDFSYVKTTSSSNKKSKNRFTGFINGGLLSVNNKVNLDNLVATIGSRKVYVRMKFGIKQNDSGSPVKPSYNCNDLVVLDYPTNTTDYYQFNGNVYNKRTSFTAGFLIGGDVRIYLGGGYGSFDPIWGIDIKSYQGNTLLNTDWALNVDRAIKGLEGEGGLFVKLGKLNIMGGVNVIYSTQTKKQHIDATAGIGLTF
jgi:hypothetical protein